MEYYVRMRETGSIINCITTEKRPEEIDLSVYSYDVYIDPNPPYEILRNYKYWDERP